MQALATILAAAGESNSQNLPYLVALFAVVVSLVALLRASTSKPERNQTAPASQPARTASVSAPSAPDSIPPEIVAVIAAAVASITGNNPVRIITIKPMSTSWERAGRQSVLTSHRIR